MPTEHEKLSIHLATRIARFLMRSMPEVELALKSEGKATVGVTLYFTQKHGDRLGRGEAPGWHPHVRFSFRAPLKREPDRIELSWTDEGLSLGHIELEPAPVLPPLPPPPSTRREPTVEEQLQLQRLRLEDGEGRGHVHSWVAVRDGRRCLGCGDHQIGKDATGRPLPAPQP